MAYENSGGYGQPQPNQPARQQQQQQQPPNIYGPPNQQQPQQPQQQGGYGQQPPQQQQQQPPQSQQAGYGQQQQPQQSSGYSQQPPQGNPYGQQQAQFQTYQQQPPQQSQQSGYGQPQAQQPQQSSPQFQTYQQQPQMLGGNGGSLRDRYPEQFARQQLMPQPSEPMGSAWVASEMALRSEQRPQPVLQNMLYREQPQPPQWMTQGPEPYRAQPQPPQQFIQPGQPFPSAAPGSERHYIGPYATAIGWKPPTYEQSPGSYESDEQYNARLAQQRAGAAKYANVGNQPPQQSVPQPYMPMIGSSSGYPPEMLQIARARGAQLGFEDGLNRGGAPGQLGRLAPPPPPPPMPTIGWDSPRTTFEQARNLGPVSSPGSLPPSAETGGAPEQPKPSPVQAAIQNAPPQRTAFPEPATPKGVSGFQDWAQSQFGRQATPQELQQIATQVGITDANNITPQQMQAAQKAASEMAKQMGAKTPAPELPTFAPPPTKATPPPASAPAPAAPKAQPVLTALKEQMAKVAAARPTPLPAPAKVQPRPMAAPRRIVGRR